MTNTKIEPLSPTANLVGFTEPTITGPLELGRAGHRGPMMALTTPFSGGGGADLIPFGAGLGNDGSPGHADGPADIGGSAGPDGGADQ